MILVDLGYRLTDLTDHPLWVHPVVRVEDLFARSTPEARRVLSLASALSARRYAAESAAIAASAAARGAGWLDVSRRAEAFVQLRAEPGVTPGDLGTALLHLAAPDAVAPGSGKALDFARWTENRRRAAEAAEAVVPDAEPRGLLAAPWAYGWSTWCHITPEVEVTAHHLVQSLDDAAMAPLCETVDAAQYSLSERADFERNHLLVRGTGFPCWKVPHVPFDDPRPEPRDRFEPTLPGWVAEWPWLAHELGEPIPLDVVLAAGTAGWEGAASPRDARDLAEAYVRAAALSGHGPDALWEHRLSWGSALRRLTEGRPLLESGRALVEAVGEPLVRSLLALRHHLATAR